MQPNSNFPVAYTSSDVQPAPDSVLDPDYDAAPTVGPLDLSAEQADILRAIARGLCARSKTKAADLMANPQRPKAWRDQYKVIEGFGEGLLYLAAELLDDESILDDPDNL